MAPRHSQSPTNEADAVREDQIAAFVHRLLEQDASLDSVPQDQHVDILNRLQVVKKESLVGPTVAKAAQHLPEAPFILLVDASRFGRGGGEAVLAAAFNEPRHWQGAGLLQRHIGRALLAVNNESHYFNYDTEIVAPTRSTTLSCFSWATTRITSSTSSTTGSRTCR
jgi:hypothetical protein